MYLSLNNEKDCFSDRTDHRQEKSQICNYFVYGGFRKTPIVLYLSTNYEKYGKSPRFCVTGTVSKSKRAWG
jgi:hypothetical protein